MNSSKKYVPRATFNDFVAPNKSKEIDEDLLAVFSYVEQGNFGVIYDFLLGKIVNINEIYKDKCLINSIIDVNPGQVSEEAKLDLIDLLVKQKGLFLNVYDSKGLTPLHFAVKNGYEKIVTYLLDNYVNINSQNDKFMTPLHYATLINLKSCPKEQKHQSLMKSEKKSNVNGSIMNELKEILFEDEIIEKTDATGTVTKNFSDHVMEFVSLFTKIYAQMILDEYEFLKQNDVTQLQNLYNAKASEHENRLAISNYISKKIADRPFPKNIVNSKEMKDIQMDYEKEYSSNFANMYSDYLSKLDEYSTELIKKTLDNQKVKVDAQAEQVALQYEKYLSSNGLNIGIVKLKDLFENAYKGIHIDYITENWAKDIREFENVIKYAVEYLTCGNDVEQNKIKEMIKDDYDTNKGNSIFNLTKIDEDENELNVGELKHDIMKLIETTCYKIFCSESEFQKLLQYVYPCNNSNPVDPGVDEIGNFNKNVYKCYTGNHNYLSTFPLFYRMLCNCKPYDLDSQPIVTDLNELYNIVNFDHLINIILNYASQHLEVKKCLDFIKNTIIERTILIKWFIENGSKEDDYLKVIFTSKDNELLSNVVEYLIKSNHEKNKLPKILAPKTGKFTIENDKFYDSVIKYIATLENVNIDDIQWLSSNDPNDIEVFKSNIIDKIKNNLLKELGTLIKFVLQNKPKKIKEENMIEFKTEYETQEEILNTFHKNINKLNFDKCEDIKKILLTYYSTITGLYQKYLYNFKGTPTDDGSKVFHLDKNYNPVTEFDAVKFTDQDLRNEIYTISKFENNAVNEIVIEKYMLNGAKFRDYFPGLDYRVVYIDHEDNVNEFDVDYNVIRNKIETYNNDVQKQKWIQKIVLDEVSYTIMSDKLDGKTLIELNESFEEFSNPDTPREQLNEIKKTISKFMKNVKKMIETLSKNENKIFESILETKFFNTDLVESFLNEERKTNENTKELHNMVDEIFKCIVMFEKDKYNWKDLLAIIYNEGGSPKTSFKKLVIYVNETRGMDDKTIYANFNNESSHIYAENMGVIENPVVTDEEKLKAKNNIINYFIEFLNKFYEKQCKSMYLNFNGPTPSFMSTPSYKALAKLFVFRNKTKINEIKDFYAKCKSVLSEYDKYIRFENILKEAQEEINDTSEFYYTNNNIINIVSKNINEYKKLNTYIHAHKFEEGTILSKLKEIFSNEFFESMRIHFKTVLKIANNGAVTPNEIDNIRKFLTKYDLFGYSSEIAKVIKIYEELKFFIFDVSDMTLSNFSKFVLGTSGTITSQNILFNSQETMDYKNLDEILININNPNDETNNFMFLILKLHLRTIGNNDGFVKCIKRNFENTGATYQKLSILSNYIDFLDKLSKYFNIDSITIKTKKSELKAHLVKRLILRKNDDNIEFIKKFMAKLALRYTMLINDVEEEDLIKIIQTYNNFVNVGLFRFNLDNIVTHNPVVNKEYFNNITFLGYFQTELSSQIVANFEMFTKFYFREPNILPVVHYKEFTFLLFDVETIMTIANENRYDPINHLFIVILKNLYYQCVELSKNFTDNLDTIRNIMGAYIKYSLIFTIILKYSESTINTHFIEIIFNLLEEIGKMKNIKLTMPIETIKIEKDVSDIVKSKFKKSIRYAKGIETLYTEYNEKLQYSKKMHAIGMDVRMISFYIKLSSMYAHIANEKYLLTVIIKNGTVEHRKTNFASELLPLNDNNIPKRYVLNGDSDKIEWLYVSFLKYIADVMKKLYENLDNNDETDANQKLFKYKDYKNIKEFKKLEELSDIFVKDPVSTSTSNVLKAPKLICFLNSSLSYHYKQKPVIEFSNEDCALFNKSNRDLTIFNIFEMIINIFKIVNKYHKMVPYSGVFNKFKDVIETININHRNFLISQFLNSVLKNSVILPSTDIYGQNNYVGRYITNEMIKQFVTYIYTKNLKPEHMKLSDSVINKINISGIDDVMKRNILTSHFNSVTEQFIISYMDKYIKAYTIAIQTDKKLEIPINISEEFDVKLGGIKSDLTDFIDGKNEIPENLDVKLIEDDEFEIVVNEHGKIEDKDNNYFVFYSYDYREKKTDMVCSTVNPSMIIKLIANGADLNIRDMNDKTPVDYMIEGRMHYLFDEEIIKKLSIPDNTINQFKSLFNSDNSIITIIKYERKHNQLYKELTPFIYDASRPFALINKHQDEFVNSLKKLELLKGNIPVNIKYIFWMFVTFQNIYWYRKISHATNGPKEYVEYEKDSVDPLKFRLKGDYDWKKYFTVEFMETKESKKIIKKLLTKKSIEASDKTKLTTIETSLKDHVVKIDETKIKSIKATNNRDEKLEIFFSTIYETFSTKANPDSSPVLYSYLWKTILSKEDFYTKPFMIHHVLSEKYSQTLKDVIINIENDGLMSEYTESVDKEKFKLLHSTCASLVQTMKPISEFINDMYKDYVLDENEMLTVNIKIYIHVLSTMLGSNMITLYMKLLYVELTKLNQADIKDKVKDITEDLEKYICSCEMKKGNFSYDYLKIALRFTESSIDTVDETNINDLFYGLSSKLKNLEKYGLNDQNISRINTIIIRYYQILYNTTLISLTEFADCYYRFIKNQYLGIVFISKLSPS